MIIVPQQIEDALWAAAADSLGPRAINRRALVSHIVSRSRLYTSERDLLEAAPPPGQGDLAARALFFTVADAAKVFVPLSELAYRGLLPRRDGLRILDVGAGAGAMTLGALAYFARRGWPGAAPGAHVTAMDRDADALGLMRGAVAALPEAWRRGVTLDTRRVSLAVNTTIDGTYDLVFAGTVFNELTGDAQMMLLEKLVARLADDGAIIVIEPALRDTSRALQALRDRVIGAALATVYAPCTRAAAPCPALADDSDWCHEDRPALLPRRTRQLADATGLRQHGLKFSYLVLRRGAERLADASEAPARTVRVVSRPRKLKGRRECFACGDDGRTRVRLLKRNRSAKTKAFENAARGDIMVLGASDELGDAEVSCTRIPLPDVEAAAGQTPGHEHDPNQTNPKN